MRYCVVFSSTIAQEQKRKQSGTKFLNRNSWKLCYLLCKKPVNGPTTIIFKCKHKVRNRSNWEIVFYFFWTKKEENRVLLFYCCNLQRLCPGKQKHYVPFHFYRTAINRVMTCLKYYIPSTINTWIILWHTKWGLCALAYFDHNNYG